MMEKFFKGLITILSLVDLAMSFNLMVTHMWEILKREPKVELEAITGLAQEKCIQAIGWVDFPMVKANT